MCQQMVRLANVSRYQNPEASTFPSLGFKEMTAELSPQASRSGEGEGKVFWAEAKARAWQSETARRAHRHTNLWVFLEECCPVKLCVDENVHLCCPLGSW